MEPPDIRSAMLRTVDEKILDSPRREVDKLWDRLHALLEN